MVRAAAICEEYVECDRSEIPVNEPKSRVRRLPVAEVDPVHQPRQHPLIAVFPEDWPARISASALRFVAESEFVEPHDKPDGVEEVPFHQDVLPYLDDAVGRRRAAYVRPPLPAERSVYHREPPVRRRRPASRIGNDGAGRGVVSLTVGGVGSIHLPVAARHNIVNCSEDVLASRVAIEIRRIAGSSSSGVRPVVVSTPTRYRRKSELAVRLPSAVVRDPPKLDEFVRSAAEPGMIGKDPPAIWTLPVESAW